MTDLCALDVSLGSKETTKPPPVFPGESPKLDELKTWIDAWDKHAATIGVMLWWFLRGVGSQVSVGVRVCAFRID